MLAERVHPDVRRRRADVALAMNEALAHRPFPGGTDSHAFAERIADLTLLLLPGPEPARALESLGRYVPQVPDEIASLLWFQLVAPRPSRPGPETFTEEIFGGDPLDGAFYETPDSRRGAYAQAPRDPEAGPRRIVARLAAWALESLVDDPEHLARAREVLGWAVDAPVLAREMVIRRAAAGTSRADVVQETGATIASVGNWESGFSIPHRHERPAVCRAYGFSEPEFERILAVTGPPERRGARPRRITAARSAAAREKPADPTPDLPPHDDCDEGGVQLRRALEGVARLGALPVWVALPPGDVKVGVWCLDLAPDDGDEDGEAESSVEDDQAPPRARGRVLPGPAWCEPPPGGVLGPIDLSTLVHRQDWTMWVIETARHIRDYADALFGAQAVDADSAATLMSEAFSLSYAYQHAHEVHSPVPDADRFVQAAHKSVAAALSSVMFVLAGATMLGRRTESDEASQDETP